MEYMCFKCPDTLILSRVDEAILYTMDELDQALDKEDVKMVSIKVAGIEKLIVCLFVCLFVCLLVYTF